MNWSPWWGGPPPMWPIPYSQGENPVDKEISRLKKLKKLLKGDDEAEKKKKEAEKKKQDATWTQINQAAQVLFVAGVFAGPLIWMLVTILGR